MGSAGKGHVRGRERGTEECPNDGAELHPERPRALARRHFDDAEECACLDLARRSRRGPRSRARGMRLALAPRGFAHEANGDHGQTLFHFPQERRDGPRDGPLPCGPLESKLQSKEMDMNGTPGNPTKETQVN